MTKEAESWCRNYKEVKQELALLACLHLIAVRLFFHPFVTGEEEDGAVEGEVAQERISSHERSQLP